MFMSRSRSLGCTLLLTLFVLLAPETGAAESRCGAVLFDEGIDPTSVLPDPNSVYLADSAGQMVGLGRGEQLLQAAEGLRQEALHLLRRHLLRVRLEEVVQRERRCLLVFEAVAS